MFIYSWTTVDIENGEKIVETGITCAENVKEALDKVVDFTSEEHDEFRLSLIAEDTLPVNNEIIVGIKESMVW